LERRTASQGINTFWTKTESQSEAYSKIRVDKIQKTISLMTLPLTEETSFGLGFFFLFPVAQSCTREI